MSLSSNDIPDDGCTVVGWVSGKFKQVHAILEYGNPVTKDSIFRSLLVGESIKYGAQNIGINTPGTLRNQYNEYIYTEKDARTGIIKPQAIVWEYPDDHQCPILLLRPGSWRKDPS